jgi:ElaA protein
MQPTPSTAQWHCLRFSDLTVTALQHIYAARQAVFVVEQQCIYMDVDGLDEQAWHLAAWSPTHRLPLAYARLFPPGVKYPEASIGRVLTNEAVRGQGWGKVLVGQALARCDVLFEGCAVRISAQAHLERFYSGFGFQAAGLPYMEDGIPHVNMRRAATGSSTMKSKLQTP